MAIWIDPRGQPTFGIGICDRCRRKLPLAKLLPDPNAPGLRVCDDGCRDVFDPYRLPARQTERINLPFARPDVDLIFQEQVENVVETFFITTEGEEPLIAEDGDNLVTES